MKKSLLISIIVFVFGVILGLFTNIEYFSIKNKILINKVLNTEYGITQIIFNNIKVLLINIFGSISFGSIAILNLIYNGFVFAILMKIIIETDTAYFFNLLPHSIEILAYIFSGAIGIYLGKIFFLNFILNKNKKISLFQVLCFFSISIMIIIISGFIEYFISTKI